MKNTLTIGFLVLFTYVPFQMGGGTYFEHSEKRGLGNKKGELAWVENIYNSMTEEERIGQLIVGRAFSDKDESHAQAVENLIKKYHIGGLTFFQGTPEKQAELTNRYQALATKVPLMISIDAEWGLGMRMKETTMSFPRQLMLGAIQDNRLIYEFGEEMARQCNRIGVHVNFAPVVDVNNNPNNPVINDRSFGEDRQNVAAKSYMYMKGMQDNNLMACAKHFPGHGDTDVDSHYDLPVINHNTTRLDSIELYPFKVLSQHGVGSMMIAHLNIPAYDNRAKVPSSLSNKVIADLLKEGLGYQGLIFTDGLEMEGARKAYKGGEVEVQALLAGNDVLLLPESVAETVAAIKKALKNGRLPIVDFETKVKKVLLAKYRLSLITPQKVELEGISRDLNDERARAVNRKLIENAITAVRNEGDLLPLSNVGDNKFASVSIGRGSETRFQRQLSFFAKMPHYATDHSISSSEQERLIAQLKNKQAVIVSFQRLSKSVKSDYGISKSALDFIKKLSKETKVVVVNFGNPYSLKFFDEMDCLVAAYEENDVTQEVAANAIFGAIRMTGRLPITASRKAKFKDGISTASVDLMHEVDPYRIGFDAEKLFKIDAIAEYAIERGATPSIQILVARGGKIAYHKAFGNHTYSKEITAAKSDIYDLASVTKIAATTLAMMKLVDDGKVNLDEKLVTYLPELQGSNKANLIVRDVLAHHAGLIAWIPFYKSTLSKTRKSPSTSLYTTEPQEGFSVAVTDRWYLKNSYTDVMWREIIDTDLSRTKQYKYSDLGFYIAAKIVERVAEKPLDVFVSEKFYEPLRLQTVGFNPLNRFEGYRIPPTEEDDYFRMQRVHGYVHDMGAAMLGGVSGHAGLFGNAKDVAVLMQLLLNKGNYAGIQYLKPETVEAFTMRYENNKRRGLGFDMKDLSGASNNMSKLAGDNTFGHLGFTGICAWADPDAELIYVFLSNRTYPTAENTKLQDLGIRPRVHTAIYEALTLE